MDTSILMKVSKIQANLKPLRDIMKKAQPESQPRVANASTLERGIARKTQPKRLRQNKRTRF